jgi:hypothetical protein
VGTEIKPLPGNGPYYFQIQNQIYHSVSLLYPNEANVAGYGQVHISYSAEATIKGLQNQSHRGHMADVKQRLGEMLRQVSPFAESYKRLHQME